MYCPTKICKETQFPCILIKLGEIQNTSPNQIHKVFTISMIFEMKHFTKFLAFFHQFVSLKVCSVVWQVANDNFKCHFRKLVTFFDLISYFTPVLPTYTYYLPSNMSTIFEKSLGFLHLTTASLGNSKYPPKTNSTSSQIVNQPM